MIDPIGTIPVYLYAVSNVPPRLHRRFAFRAVVIAALVLLLFLIGGQFVLMTLGLRLGSFRIAGGIVLFLFAMTMIFGVPSHRLKSPKPRVTTTENTCLARFFPSRWPSIASPGAMLALARRDASYCRLDG